MDKLIERGLLFDFYGELLTEHQQRIYSEAVFNDLSLGELSLEEGISRQGIHDLIKRCDKILEGYEEKLQLIERFKKLRSEVNSLSDLVSKSEMDSELKTEIQNGLKNIIEEL